MKCLNNELFVQRNEDFSLDKLLENKEKEYNHLRNANNRKKEQIKNERTKYCL